MATIGLSLVLSAKSGSDVESIGGVFGLPVYGFNVPGGPWQPIVAGDPVKNVMVIGDELKEAIFRQQLQIMREGDAHSIDAYKAFQRAQRFLIIAHVYVKDVLGIHSSATLTIENAKMIEFKRKKLGGILSSRHGDIMKFLFAKGNAKLEYGHDINKAAKDNGIGTAIMKVLKKGL
jgi:hypothetical protein